MITEARNLDASFLASLENGVGTVNFDGFIVNENIKFVSERVGSSEEPSLRSEEGLLPRAHGLGKAGE